MKVKVSVIIPTYQREAVLINTLNSVVAQDSNSFELIVVDQTAKHDGRTEQFLSSLKDKRFRYFSITPPSLPAARNFGLTKARGEIIIYIDDDVTLDEGFIKAHLDCYKNYPDICAVAGRIRKKGQPMSKKLAYFNNANFLIGGFNFPDFAFVETGQGCNMSFKKILLKQVNGFDTNFIGNAVREESDVFFKLKRLGCKVLYSPKASLFHLETKVGGCGKDENEFLKKDFYRNEVYFFLKYRNILYLPYFLLRRLKRYVIRGYTIRNRILMQRLIAFTMGLILGFEVYLNPKKQIVSKIISRVDQ